MAPSKSSRNAIPPKSLTVHEIKSGIERLNRRIQDLRAYDVSSGTGENPPQLVALSKAIEDTLERVFGQGTSQYVRYYRASQLRFDNGGFYVLTPGWSDPEPSPSEIKAGISSNIESAIVILEQAVRSLEEDLLGMQPEPAESLAIHSEKSLSKKVFVVHGRDEAAKEKVARYLAFIGFDPIILHEQANEGQTIIEKFERHGDVGFAVVLLTPDDVGGAKDGELAPRARQNVVLELGYFMGRLTRARVCALKSGDLELPTDFAGVVYEEMDTAGAWKQALARELQSAGHEVDWNKVMRPLS